eukprot:157330_1
MADDDFGDDGDDWGDDDGGDGDWGDGGDADEWGDGGGGDADIPDDGGGADSWEIECENLYYTAESDIKHDPSSALSNFLKCIALEEEKGGDKVDKRFNALKFVVILLFGFGSSKKNEMISEYKKLLSYA